MTAKIYGRSDIRGLRVHVPSGRGQDFIDAFAPTSRKPGKTITNYEGRIDEDGRTVVLDFDYTALHGSHHTGRGDMDSNIHRWVQRAAKSIGEGSHKARIIGPFSYKWTRIY